MSDLEKVKEALELLPDEMEGYYCPECKSEVDATYYENCATCGFYIGDCQPSNKTARFKKEAIIALESAIAERERLREALLKIINDPYTNKFALAIAKQALEG